MVVVEVQERVRRVAAKGLVSSNIGKNWSTPMLRARLLGRWVKFSGWLFYDADHHLESWQVDTQNTLDGNNWRETGCEIGYPRKAGHRYITMVSRLSSRGRQ